MKNSSQVSIVSKEMKKEELRRRNENMKGQWLSESFETLCHATYAARSSADVRIVGANVSIINMIHVAVVFLLAVLLIGYVDEGLLQNSGRGSLLLRFEKVALSNYYLVRTRNHEDGFYRESIRLTDILP